MVTNRHYDPNARYPEGTYPRSDWDHYRGDYSGGYGPYNPNARFYEAPYAGGHRDRDRDGDNDRDHDDNHNNHSHHHHHDLFHNLF